MPDTATIAPEAETLTFADQPRRYGMLVPSSSTAAWLWKATRAPETAATIEAQLDQPSHIVILDPQSYVFTFTEHALDTWLERVQDVSGACLLIEAKEQSGATTEPSRTPAISTLTTTLDRIMTAAEHEDFEVGMCSEFETKLRDFVGEYGERAITALHGRLQRGVGIAVILEALTALGRMRHSASRDARLKTLAAFLQHRQAATRDAAVQGLLDIEDERARPLLRQALAAESNDLLRKSFAEALTLLPE